MPNGFPRLELFFEESSGLLKHSNFFETQSSFADSQFCNVKSGSFFTEEICIFLILCKYHGKHANPAKKIAIEERSKANSWLRALDIAFRKDTNLNFFKECFGSVDFLTTERGTSHIKKILTLGKPSYPAAKFDPS